MNEEFDYDSLCPGIVGFVKLLHRYHFKTTDSGDGSLKKSGMDCGWEEPMVVVVCDKDVLVTVSRQLYNLVDSLHLEDVNIEGTFYPGGAEYCSVILYGEGLRDYGESYSD